MDFRENLRFIMDSKGIQTKELSALSGISENTIKSYLKSDGAEPNVSKALALSKALNVSLDYLISGAESDISINPEISKIALRMTKFSSADIQLVDLFTKVIEQK